MPRRQEDWEKSRALHPSKCGRKWNLKVALKLASSAPEFGGVSPKGHMLKAWSPVCVWGYWEMADTLGGEIWCEEVRSLEACHWMVLRPPPCPVTLSGGQLCMADALPHHRPKAAELTGCGLGALILWTNRKFFFLRLIDLRYLSQWCNAWEYTQCLQKFPGHSGGW